MKSKLFVALLAAGLLGAVPPAQALNHSQTTRHARQVQRPKENRWEKTRDNLDDTFGGFGDQMHSKFGEFGDHMHRKFGKFGDDLHDWWDDVKPW